MGWRRIALIAVAVVAAFFLIVISTSHSRGSTSTTFHVLVPPETPPLDAITVNVQGDVFPMHRVGDLQYEATVNTTGYDAGSPISYGYTRGGFGNTFGEVGWNGNVGNRTFEPGARDNYVNDTIGSWKWLSPSPQPNIPSSVSSASVIRRDFWAGPDMVDFWNGNFPLQYNSTIAHLKSEGYTWVELDPPWDYRSIDPPVMSNGNVTVPSWPADGLREEIRAFKSAGFRVYLGPQVCCTDVDFTGRSDAWWSAWYDQYQNFVQFHADLAREEHVDAMSISPPEPALPGSKDAPSFAKQRMDEIFDIEKSSGAPVGMTFFVLNPVEQHQQLWPQEGYAFMGKLDFLAVAMWNNVSSEEFPSQGEIDAGFDKVFGELDYAHNATGKPVVFAQTAYFSRNGSAEEKGPEEFPTWGDPSDAAPRYDARTQAMLYESIMKYAANRSYIEGVFPFGYWYVSSPLNLDSDIRDKPAEGIFSKWAAKIAAAS